jgi:hypothetical protein
MWCLWAETASGLLWVDTNAAVMHSEASFLVHASGAYPHSRWSIPMEFDGMAEKVLELLNELSRARMTVINSSA